MASDFHSASTIARESDYPSSTTSNEQATSSSVSVDSQVRAVSSMAHWEVSAAAAEPPWPTPPHGSYREFQRFERYPNYLAACIVAGLLENEGVPPIVESSGIFPDTESSTIWVPKELMHRARWILAFPPPTHEELTFLATGELRSDEEVGSPHRHRFVTWIAVFIMIAALVMGLAAQCGWTSHGCI
jgi:hypothetical protein